MGTREDYSYILIREAIDRLGHLNDWAIGMVQASDADQTVVALIGAGDHNLVVGTTYAELDNRDLQAGQQHWADLIAAAEAAESQPEPEPESEPEPEPEKPVSRRRK